MKKNIIVTAGLVAILAVLLAVIGMTSRPAPSESPEAAGETPYSCGAYATGTVAFGNVVVSVEIADTDCKRALGLSGRTKLATSSGMLFAFPADGNYGFWMKDMNFPLDMVWIGSDLSVVGVVADASPASYDAAEPSASRIFGEQYLARYVVELPAGFAAKNGITVGNSVSISADSLQ